MKEALERIPNSPLDFLLVCLGIAILLGGAGQFVPRLLQIVLELFRIICDEFTKNRKDRTTTERLNMAFVIVLSVLTALAGLFELLPPVVTQAIGASAGTAPQTSGNCFLCGLCFVFAMCMASALWLFLQQRDSTVHASRDRALARAREGDEPAESTGPEQSPRSSEQERGA